jgi:extracellular factor (EF) 3-hydroxypalmitic acid methyl ester biosynthesis protein
VPEVYESQYSLCFGVENGLFISFEMNQTTNSNGNGETGQKLRQLKEIVQSETAAGPSKVKESLVTFQTADGLELHGVLAHMTRHTVVFELYNPRVTPRFSEVLSDFKIILQDRTIYSGHVVVCNVVDTGLNIVCEATLNETHWRDVNLDAVVKSDERLVTEFKVFVEEWQKSYKILPEYKEAVADIETFLTDLRIWLEQIELGIRSSPKLSQAHLEGTIIDKLSPQIIPVIDALFEKFERIAARLDDSMRPAHRHYIQRHLHPIVLCAPFASRTYQKPLGYAGDYEMVNMMDRNPKEGASLFAKIFNVWLLQQNSAGAHRNRLDYLTKQIETETFRVTRTGGKARIFNFACGPAIEVQIFLGGSALGKKVEFTLADFERETLEYVKKAIDKINERSGWQPSVRFQKQTVFQLLKESQKPLVIGDHAQQEYDLIYCAGLFDYLPDNTCKQLIKIFYQRLAPDGLLIVTNVTPLCPNQGSLELILDWHLTYRDVPRLERLCSGIVSRDGFRIRSDSTGVNIFLEVRKSNEN